MIITSARCHLVLAGRMRKEYNPTMDNLYDLAAHFETLRAGTALGEPLVLQQAEAISLHLDSCTIQSRMRRDLPDELVLGYTQTMMGFLIFNSAPETMAMIGLGGGSLAKYCHRYLPNANITVIENDARVLALREQFFIPPDQERFQVLMGDGAGHVKGSTNQYDVLLVDGFDRAGQPASLCTQDFYDDCFGALSPDGVMVVNLLGTNTTNRDCIARIKHSFCDAVTVVNANDSTNKIVFACKGGGLDLPDYVLLGRLRGLACDHTVKLGSTVQRILLQRRLRRVAGLSA